MRISDWSSDLCSSDLLVDEAASRLRMQVDSKPEEIDELDRRIIQLKIEREALKKESDPASRDRLDTLEGELAELEQSSATLTARWQSRSEEHTSELQSLMRISYAVFCLKKKKKQLQIHANDSPPTHTIN